MSWRIGWRRRWRRRRLTLVVSSGKRRSCRHGQWMRHGRCLARKLLAPQHERADGKALCATEASSTNTARLPGPRAMWMAHRLAQTVASPQVHPRRVSNDKRRACRHGQRMRHGRCLACKLLAPHPERADGKALRATEASCTNTARLPGPRPFPSRPASPWRGHRAPVCTAAR